MEIFYPVDSPRLPVEIIQELNEQLFDSWDDGGVHFEDNDNPIEGLSIITEEEFLEGELNGD